LETRLRSLYLKLRNRGVTEKAIDVSDMFTIFPGYVQLAGERMATAGLARLKRWPEVQRMRRETAGLIENAFQRAGLPLWPIPREADITLLRYPILSDYKKEILNQANRYKLDIAGWYNSPVHPLLGKNLSEVNYRMGDCPRSESLIPRLLHIPTGPRLSRKILERIIGILVLNNHNDIDRWET
jgi:dTDP-4-amino-4,6-dideoxygalactose transaminase